MLAYDFGPRHPLRPERLRRAVSLVQLLARVPPIDPGEGDVEDVLRVHDASYVEEVARASQNPAGASGYGLGSLDNPAFEGMHEAALAYCAGSAAAARAVLGGSKLAVNLSGGLHHALRDRASGFCVYNDPAIAIAILRERYERVAYIDIDVHHGDGVQWIFYSDPSVLTASIHESGRTLFPGTGFPEETGAQGTSVNVELPARATGDIWLETFERGILPALEIFGPQAIVLQMGTDPHFLDPLAHLQVAVQEWLGAVRAVRDLGLPIVAVGGGGYNLTTVPRMWAAAVLTLMRLEVPHDLPAGYDSGTFLDPELPQPRRQGEEEAHRSLRRLEQALALARG